MQEQPTTPVAVSKYEVRCWQCQKFHAILIEFIGRIEFRCPRCHAFTVWRNGSIDLDESRSIVSRTHSKFKSQLTPRHCESCQRITVFVTAFSGRIYYVCRACKRRNYYDRHDIPERIQDSIDGLPNMEVRHDARLITESEDLYVEMERRWETMIRVRAKARAEVAVGLRFDVFRRDGFRCRYCGRSVDDGVTLHADHVIPVSRGGQTLIDNLVTACLECNLGKSDKDLT